MTLSPIPVPNPIPTPSPTSKSAVKHAAWKFDSNQDGKEFDP